jgi:hypothetical protein
MKKVWFGIGVGLVGLLIGGLFWFTQRTGEEGESLQAEAPEYTGVTVTIDGKEIPLTDGYAEAEAAPGSASKIVTKVQGEPYAMDFNLDGKEDKVFVVTQETGGSGTFFYAAAAVATDDGFVGTDTYFLGDRIDIQSVMESPSSRHKQVAVFSFTDRVVDGATTTTSFVKSVYLKLDMNTLRWVFVEQNFTDETTYTERYSAQVDQVVVVFEHTDYTRFRLTTNGAIKEGELNTERGYKEDPDATVYVLDWQKPADEQMRYVRLTNDPGRIYLLDSNNELITGTPLLLE